jgi:hypothetical protein
VRGRRGATRAFMHVLDGAASAGGRGIKQLAATRRTLQRACLAARALEHSAHCTSDQRTARNGERRDSAAVSGWRVMARALCSSDRR